MLYCVLFFNGTHVRNFVFVFVCICIFLLCICVFPIFGILWTQLVVQQWNPCEWVARTPLVTRSPSWRHFLLHLRNTNISASKYKLNANYVAHMGFTSYHWLQKKTAADATFCKWHPPGAQEKAWGQICPPWVLKVQKVLGYIGLRLLLRFSSRCYICSPPAIHWVGGESMTKHGGPGNRHVMRHNRV